MKPINQLIQQEGAIQDRSIFWDEDIYQKEMEEIFARCWLFLTHESIIPDEGDYQATTMGEDSVVVARQKDGTIKAFVNSCTHRGNAVCFSDGGMQSHSPVLIMAGFLGGMAALLMCP